MQIEDGLAVALDMKQVILVALEPLPERLFLLAAAVIGLAFGNCQMMEIVHQQVESR